MIDKKHIWKPTIQELANEIHKDLPDLLSSEEAGDGTITLQWLCGYYGDTFSRIMSACEILQSRKWVVIKRRENNTYYITHPSRNASPLDSLTDAQKRLMEFIILRMKITNKQTLQTDLGFLSRALKSSYGGMTLRMERLTSLGFLEVIESPKQGKQMSMLIKLGPKMEQKETP